MSYPAKIGQLRKLRSDVCWSPGTRRTDISKRRNHDAAFKARLALKGESRVSELATAYEVHPTMIHLWTKAPLKGAAGIFEPGGKAAAAEDAVRDLHAKIGVLAVANDFSARKLKPWTGK